MINFVKEVLGYGFVLRDPSVKSDNCEVFRFFLRPDSYFELIVIESESMLPRFPFKYFAKAQECDEKDGFNNKIFDHFDFNTFEELKWLLEKTRVGQYMKAKNFKSHEQA